MLAAVIVSGTWQPGGVTVLGIHIGIQNLARDLVLVGLLLASWLTTSRATHERNGYTWGPIREVAILFAAIFATIIPVLAGPVPDPGVPHRDLAHLLGRRAGLSGCRSRVCRCGSPAFGSGKEPGAPARLRAAAARTRAARARTRVAAANSRAAGAHNRAAAAHTRAPPASTRVAAARTRAPPANP
ncbi:MAG: sodium:proton antiporter [Acidobacteriota bacterium]